MSFKQSPPDITGSNQYLSDHTLRSIIQYYIFSGGAPTLGDNKKETQPAKSHGSSENSHMNVIHDELVRFGADVVSKTMLANRFAAENPQNYPRLRTYDAWQNRIDDLELHESWRYFETVAAKEGLVATGYGASRVKYGPMARVLQFAKLYLFDASSAVYTCPLAMTDGAARLMELQLAKLKRSNCSGEAAAEVEHRQRVYSEALKHLTTCDPSEFWTSGQWMTEKPGGSDVRNTETVATRVNLTVGDDATKKYNCYYHLNGFKWFTSATNSQMTLALAKIEGSNDLSLFLVKIRNETGKLNGIKIHKLKDKLGTQALPTAELSLKNTVALLVGEAGKGVQTISCMLNITRLYNSICATSAMRRMIVLIQDYSTKRKAFGKLLMDHALYTHWLAKMVSEQIGCLHFVMNVVHLMGKSECGVSSQVDEELLRLMIPVAKLYTGKRCVQLLSEGVEMIGGQGYIEDTGIPALLRNGQVLPIWEGTTIVLSLDVVRVLSRNVEVINSWKQRILDMVDAHRQDSELYSVVEKIREAAVLISSFVSSARDSKNEMSLQLYARELSFSIAQTYIASLLLCHAHRHVLDQFMADHDPLAPIKVALENTDNKAMVHREQFVSKL